MSNLIRWFNNADAGATAVNSNAGTLVALLDAVLVNGQNSGSCTITRSGATATVTRTAHGFLERQCIEIAGANETEYNGLFYAVSVTANTFTVTVSGSPATPATGTITCKQAAAGLSIAHTGTNKRAYRLGSIYHALQHLFRIDDTSGGTAGLRGYETMSDVDTGTNPFPTIAQAASAPIFYKATSTANRQYNIFSNGRTVYSFINYSTINNADYIWTAFGAFTPFNNSNGYNTFLIGDASDTTNATRVTQAGNYASRAPSGAAGAVLVGKMHDGILHTSSSITIGAGNNASPLSGGGYIMSQIKLCDASEGLIGWLPGIYAPGHNRAWAHGTIRDGEGALAGRKLFVQNVRSTGQVLIDLTGPW